MSFETEHRAFANKQRSQIDGLCPDSEKNDGATFGQSLINFMTLATGSVKTALQKPANYKKNINHRRYLQKQLKICSRRKKRSTKAKTGPKAKKGASKQALGTASDVWFGQANCGDIFMASEGNLNQQFSANNNLFLPYEAAFNGVGSGYNIQNSVTNSTNFQNRFPWNNFTYAGQEQANLLAKQQIDNTSSAFFRDDSLPVMLDEEAEQFLTGEELTHVLDIKDLFVPERAHAENGSNDVLKFNSSCTFDENIYSGFQTVPSTSSILSW
jgi:hypothetical protein